jgi:hypothetical protein
MSGMREHPNSLAASHDPAVQQMIRRGRAKQAADARSIETWARNDCGSGSFEPGYMLPEERTR